MTDKRLTEEEQDRADRIAMNVLEELPPFMLIAATILPRDLNHDEGTAAARVVRLAMMIRKTSNTYVQEAAEQKVFLLRGKNKDSE